MHLVNATRHEHVPSDSRSIASNNFWESDFRFSNALAWLRGRHANVMSARVSSTVDSIRLPVSGHEPVRFFFRLLLLDVKQVNQELNGMAWQDVESLHSLNKEWVA